MTVAACLIVKDGATTIERCLASVRPHVEEICIYDTGSTDGTLELLDRLAGESGTPIRVERGQWRDDFGWAREQSFAMASPEHEWIIWLDADDELVIDGGTLGDVIQLARDAPCLFVSYDYCDLADGPHAFLRERIVRRAAGGWEGIVHENWRPAAGTVAYQVPADVMYVRHQRREPNQPGHYLRLLVRAAEDPSRNPRALYYLGLELGTLGMWSEAAAALARYLDEGHDAIEGEPNNLRLSALERAADAFSRTGNASVASEFRLACVSYLERVQERLRTLTAAETAEPPRRNDPCWCGSGRKFKRCHRRMTSFTPHFLNTLVK